MSFRRNSNAAPLKPANGAGHRPLTRTTRLLAGALCFAATVAFAQNPPTNRYYPLDQSSVPGVAGQWSTAGRKNLRPGWQIIRVDLPNDAGQVEFYSPTEAKPVTKAAPASAAVVVGGVYRFKISQLPDFPGVELYPTVELLDRLHPPRGRETEFPMPVEFTRDEIRLALEGRLITKVLYLEQPNRAAPARNAQADRTLIVGPTENALALADREGRPMAIVRLGGRVPFEGAADPGFYGNGAPIRFEEIAPTPAGGARP